MMSTPFSLANPPTAPRKAAAPLWRPWAMSAIPKCPNFGTEEEDERMALQMEEEFLIQEEERNIYESLEIRPKYLRWTPSEVLQIDNKETLQFLYHRYKFPSSQPRNADEIFYLEVMSETILERIASLTLRNC